VSKWQSDVCVGSAVQISMGLCQVDGKNVKDRQKGKEKCSEIVSTQRRRDRNES
jgi:predicted nucleic acid-binding Zn ribbon protein